MARPYPRDPDWKDDPEDMQPREHVGSEGVAEDPFDTPPSVRVEEAMMNGFLARIIRVQRAGHNPDLQVQ